MIPDIKVWLKILTEGEFPLLKKSDRQTIEHVFTTTRDEIQSRNTSKSGNDNNISEKLSIMNENLIRIVEFLKQSKSAKGDFIRGYPEWCKLRKNNIESLLALGNSMHTHRKNCNVSRLVGNCTSLVGGGLCVASAALIPFTMGLTTPLAVAGGTMTALGSATSVGTSISEISILKKKIQEASEILEKDKDSTEQLQLWFRHANDLSETTESFLLLDIGKDAMHVMRNFVKVAITAKGIVETNEHLNDFVQFVLNHLQLNVCTNALVVACFISLLLITILLYNYNSRLFDHVAKTSSIMAGFAPLIGSASNIAGIASTIIKPEAKIASDVGKAVSRGTVAVFSMSLDIASIVLTSIDIHKGSLCGKGEELIQIAGKLQEEADTMEKTFDELMDEI